MLSVWHEGQRIDGETVEISARIEAGADQHRLWYRLPRKWQPAVTDLADSFVLATLQWAMRLNQPLTVHGRVSRSLLANLDEWQAVWATWLPQEYHRIEIIPDEVDDAPAGQTKASVAAFSGGVDSTYTVWRHTRKQNTRWSSPLTAGLMVHGFDIPLSRPAAFAEAAKKSREMLADVGLELIECATNFKEIPHSWEHCFAAAAASALALVQKQFDTGLLGSSHAYDEVHQPWGSTPVGDPLLSSHGMRIVHDGADAKRIEKVAAISTWPAARRLLRVCWEGPETEKNCCRCEKCVRTMVEFLSASGKVPEAFPQGLADEQLTNLYVFGAHKQVFMEQAIAVTKARGERGRWLGLLQTAVSRSKRIERFPRWYRLRGQVKRAALKLAGRAVKGSLFMAIIVATAKSY